MLVKVLDCTTLIIFFYNNSNNNNNHHERIRCASVGTVRRCHVDSSSINKFQRHITSHFGSGQLISLVKIQKFLLHRLHFKWQASRVGLYLERLLAITKKKYTKMHKSKPKPVLSEGKQILHRSSLFLEPRDARYTYIRKISRH